MQNVSIITYLIVCPFVFLAGFVDSIGGGGGLISLPGYLIAGLPPVVASATNKLSAFMGTSVAFANYTKKGFVRLKVAIPASIFAIVFSSLGAKVQTMIPENVLKVFMLIALPLSLLIMLNKNAFKMQINLITHFGRKEYIEVFIISSVMGFYDGIYGPGCGTFLILLFVNVVGMTLKESNGLAKAINLATNIGALLYFIKVGLPIFSLGIVAGIFNMIGCYIGSNLFAKKGNGITRPIMIIVMLIFMIKIIFELFVFKG